MTSWSTWEAPRKGAGDRTQSPEFNSRHHKRRKSPRFPQRKNENRNPPPTWVSVVWDGSVTLGTAMTDMPERNEEGLPLAHGFQSVPSESACSAHWNREHHGSRRARQRAAVHLMVDWDSERKGILALAIRSFGCDMPMGVAQLTLGRSPSATPEFLWKRPHRHPEVFSTSWEFQALPLPRLQCWHTKSHWMCAYWQGAQEAEI